MTSAKDTVLAKYSTAFVDPGDDIGWVHIMFTKIITEKCSNCKQNWEHPRANSLGSGETESDAWEDAARNLDSELATGTFQHFPHP